MFIGLKFSLCDRGRHLRMVPCFGVVHEQALPAARTTRYRGKYPRSPLMANFAMTDSQQTTLTLKFTDKKGNPVPQPAGTLSWLVDNTEILALTPAADNLSCLVAAVGPLGTATVSVKLADPTGSPVAAGQVDVTVTSGAATTIAIDPGTPSEQP